MNHQHNTRIAILFLTSIFVLSCAQNPKQVSSAAAPAAQPQEKVAVLDKSVTKLLSSTVFEVVVPKVEDSFMVYEKSLPKEKLDYTERTDAYSSIGTAFAIEPGKYITAAHVFALEFKTPNKDLSYYIRNSAGKVFKVSNITKYHREKDMVEFEVANAPILNPTLKVVDHSEVGDTVYTVGNAQGEGIAIRSGQLASFTVEEKEGRWKFIRFSAAVNPGNSGGPLVNSKGEVVGIVVRKNKNENLNYAVPIDLFTALDRKQAYFELPDNYPLTINVKETFKPTEWNFKTPLPAPLTVVSKKANEDLFKLYSKLRLMGLKKMTEEKTSSKDELLKYSLMQSYTPAPNALLKDSDQKWGLYVPKMETTTLENDRHFSSGTVDLKLAKVYPFYLLRKKGQSLKDLYSDIKGIHDSLLKGLSWARTYAGESIKIVSYGPPQSVEAVRDSQGRPWFEAKWRSEFDNKTVFLYFHPVPDGVIGIWSYFQTGFETVQADKLMRDFAEQTVSSYNAKLVDWKEYQKLDKKYLPTYFSQLKIDYQKNQVKLETANFHSNFALPDVTDESSFTVMRGIDPDDVNKFIFFGFNIQSANKQSTYQANFMFDPKDLWGNEAQLKWQDVKTGKGKFDAQTYTSGNETYSLAARPLTGRMPASKQTFKNDRAVVFVCSENNTAKTDFANHCEGFKTGFKIP